MFRFDLLTWWYSKGWSWTVRYFCVVRNQHILELFSVKEVSRTLFSPYRQTFAGSTRGNISAKFRALIDKTISRAIGFVIRLFLILTGLIFVTLNSIAGLLAVIFWPFIPATPVIALTLLVGEVVYGL